MMPLVFLQLSFLTHPSDKEPRASADQPGLQFQPRQTSHRTLDEALCPIETSVSLSVK